MSLITISHVGHGVQKDAEGWEHYAFTVTLRHTVAGNSRLSMEFPYRMGMRTSGVPELGEVLNSLLWDYACWKEDNPDVRLTAAQWREMERTVSNLENVLGEDVLSALLVRIGDEEELMALCESGELDTEDLP